MWPIAAIASWGMFGVGIVMLIAILLRRSSRYLKKTRIAEARERSSARSRQPRSEPLLDAPVEVLRWQVEMHELTRELKGEIDSKLIALQELTRMANEQATRLEEALQRAERAPAVGPDPVERIEQLGAAADLAELKLPEVTGGWPRRDSPLDEADTQRAQELAASGVKSQQIAECLGAAIGDVEWVLSQRRRGESDGSPSPRGDEDRE